MAKIATLADNFDDNSLNTGLWTATNNAGVVGSETGSRYQFAIAPSTAAYSYLTSVATYDLTNSAVYVQLVDEGDQGIGSLEIFIVEVHSDSNNRLFWYLSGGFWGCYKTVAGVQTGLAFDARDPDIHKWFRIRETSGTTYWETSADAVSWTVQYSESTPITVTAVYAELRAGEYAGGAGDATTVAIDNVNTRQIPLAGATNTHSANVLGRQKTRALGGATETDTAGALGQVKVRALGGVEETSTAGQLGAVKARALGGVTETDTAGPLAPVKARALGGVEETSTAGPLGKVKTRAIGGATETDTAGALVATKGHALGGATYTETAGPLGRVKTRAIGGATETDTAGPLTRVGARTLVVRPFTGYVIRP